MKHYYLSYVEASGHACLILSEDSNDGHAVRVTRNIGYWPRFDYLGHPDLIPEATKVYPGYVSDENTVSKLRYGKRVKGYHKTFIISGREKAELLKIIENDQRINFQNDFKYGKKYVTAGGPDYLYVGFNCKAYILSVFERLGIREVNQPHNFLIERPGVSKNKMTSIESTMLTCPEKDDFIADFDNLVDDILYQDKANKKSLAELNEKIRKLGFSCDIDSVFSVLNKATDGLNDKREFVIRINELQLRARKIEKKYENMELKYYWRTIPRITPRSHDLIKNEDEVMKLEFMDKTSSVIDGLKDIKALLVNGKIKRYKNKEFVSDACKLIEFVNEGLGEATKLFDRARNPNHKITRKDMRELNDSVIDAISKKLESFKPESSHANIFIQLLDSLLMLFKRDYIPHESTRMVGLFSTRYKKIQKQAYVSPNLVLSTFEK